MSIKRILIFVTLLLIAAQLAACAPKAASTPETPTQATQPAEQKPTEQQPSAGKLPDIVVACWSGPEHDNLVKLAAAYEQKTGNKVVVEEIAREAYFDKLTTTFVAGGSDYDVAYISSDWPPAWIKANALKDISQYMNDPKVASPDLNVKVFEPAIDVFKFDGKYYAFPSEGDTAWMFYRKDLLDAKGIKVPETWDEYLDAARKLNNPPEMYGAVIGAKPDEAMWDFMHYLWGFGGDILGPDYKPLINNDASVSALTFYSSLLKEKLVPPDVATYGYNEILTTLQQGKAALGIEWMAATQTLQDCSQSPKVCKDGKPLLEYALVPGHKGADGKVVRGQGASQWGWVIPAGAKNPEAGYKFIEWLTSKEGAKMWALNGGIPSNVEALSDPDVVAKIPQFKLLAEAMPYRHLVPPLTITSDMVTALNEAIVASVTGTKEPKKAADDVAAKITEMLTKAGYLK